MSKALLRFTLSSKRILTLSKSVSSLKLCHTSHTAKDTLSEENKNSIQLIEFIKQDSNPTSLLEKIKENKKEINGYHVVLALESMQKFYESKAIDPQDVQKREEFVDICSILQKHLMGLNLSQTIQALKILNILKVPSSTVIIQSLLQLVRQSVNDLTLNQIFYLSFVLKNMKATNLGEALIVALPEVFKANYKLKLDIDNPNELRNALRYASEYKLNKKVINNIVDALNKFGESFPLNTAVALLWSLADLEIIPDNLGFLLNRIYTIIEINITELKSPEVTRTIIKMCDKISDGVEEFYEPTLLDKLIKKVIDEDYGFDRGIVTLKKLNKLRHINIPLLDYVSSTCNLDSITKYPINMVTLMRGLAIANYTPSNWKDLQIFIRENCLLLPDHVQLSHLTLYLASFDCFDSKILQIIFTSDQNPKLLSDSYRQILKQLYQSVKTLYPEYSGPWPMDAIVESFKTTKEFSEEKPHLLKFILERILGGSDYLINKIRTNLEHEIDHLIVLQDGNPIVIDTVRSTEDSHGPLYIENLNIPLNCERVAVQLLPVTSYGRNIRILDAKDVLNIKSLEAMSLKVVHISIEQWYEMPEHERFPFLKESIGLNEKKNNEAKDSDEKPLWSSKVKM